MLDLSLEDLKSAVDGFIELPPPPQTPPRSAVWCVGDAGRLPFADNSFDVVICSEVLEHLPDVDAALDEITRIVKPGGRFALSVPRGHFATINATNATNAHKTKGPRVSISNWSLNPMCFAAQSTAMVKSKLKTLLKNARVLSKILGYVTSRIHGVLDTTLHMPSTCLIAVFRVRELSEKPVLRPHARDT